MSQNDSTLITISRTIYDPSTKDFITSTSDAKSMPNIKQWITDHNPVIYWYVLRIDNATDASIDQWAVELYAHQALSITEVYVDGIDRMFEVRKRERDPWSEKYVLSIPRQVGIPLIGKGTRRIFFKVDIDCKEGLMHEYGISGQFVAQGMDPVEIKEKMFHYSCKVGEFKQIFNNNPDEASLYAEKRLVGKYSSNSVQVFTNSFRMIHELSNYCHSDSLDSAELLQKLHLLHASFKSVSDIAGERISPLISDSIRELDNTFDKDDFKRRFIKLCNALVELLHIEVMGAEMKEEVVPIPAPEPVHVNTPVKHQSNGNYRAECPTCRNIISESNKSLICTECGTQFCITCEEWFRGERKRGEGPLCKNCYVAEQDRLREVVEHKAQMEREREERFERERKEKAEQERLRKQKEDEERQRKQREEEEIRLRNEKERHNKLATEGNSIGIKFTLIQEGEFMMGSQTSEEGRFDWEGPVHKVTIKKPFYLGTYPVTQREWKAVMGDNPSNFKGDDLPVEQVSWNDVQEFIRKLNEKEGTDKYRLPSEAEWEYSCRAGTTTEYCFGDSESQLGEYAWYDDNSGGKTHPVGQKKPNTWGLYDMHGNVLEWVQDEWHHDYKAAPTDGSAWEDGSSTWEDGGFSRVHRGGSLFFNAQASLSAHRDYISGGALTVSGFRVLKEQ